MSQSALLHRVYDLIKTAEQLFPAIKMLRPYSRPCRKSEYNSGVRSVDVSHKHMTGTKANNNKILAIRAHRIIASWNVSQLAGSDG